LFETKSSIGGYSVMIYSSFWNFLAKGTTGATGTDRDGTTISGVCLDGEGISIS
jgi:hypothetical protein